MKDQLIQSLSNYTTALEQKISALEQRIALLEENAKVVDNLQLTINKLQTELATLTAVGIVAASTNENPTTAIEPEVEIEIIIDESQVVENMENPDNLEVLDNLDTLEIDETPEEPVEPEVVKREEASAVAEAEELPLVEPIAPVVEATSQPVEAKTTTQPAARPVPQQTSLFGSTVEDIRQAISLGDRFLFQRELFAGNGELMQKTLDEINTLGSLNEAMEYVLNNFEWDQESTAVKLFENVLKRRFN